MKKLILLLFCASLPMAGMAQKDTKTNDNKTGTNLKEKVTKAKAQDFIYVHFNWMTMLGADQNVSISPFSRGMDFGLVWDQPIGKSPISFAAGVGFSFENVFMNSFLRDSLNNGEQTLYFKDINATVNPLEPNPSTPHWRKYKLSTAIIELPIEFRYRMKTNTRNTFKFSLGFKVGYVIDSWEKYVGLAAENYGNDLMQEVRNVRYGVPGISRLRYGATFKIGYSRFQAYAHYSIGGFFQDGKGIKPGNMLHVGFCFTPF